MGMDGLSMSNTGALKESTSADYNVRSEQSIQSDKSNDAKQIQTTSSNPKVKEKDEEEGKKQKQEKKQENDEEFNDGYAKLEEELEKEDFLIEDLENPEKDFYVKLNAKDDIIELYDSASERLIETISGNEMQELVKKLNMASGIFINKKV